MIVTEHIINHLKVAEVISDEILIKTPQDSLDLLGELYYQGFDQIIIHKKNLSNDFFDLKNGLAGEILQKFSTYRVKLAIVGNFRTLTSKSLNDFIYESNKSGHIIFVESLSDILDSQK